MDFQSEEIQKDVHFRAAKLTNDLMDAAGIQQDRSKFAQSIETVAMKYGEEVVSLERDSVTGLYLNSIMRKNVAERLKQGESGTLVVVDMVGLKHLNSFSHVAGDSGLRTMADALREFGFTELGRKGDEFYGFMSGMTNEEFEKKFGEFLDRKQGSGEMREPKTNTNLLSYWSSENVGSLSDLDAVVEELDMRVEGVKKRVSDRIRVLIDWREEKNNKAELLVLFLNHRDRVKEEVITQLALALEQRFRDRYKIPDDIKISDESVLRNIPDSIKKEFYEIQEKALREKGLVYA